MKTININLLESILNIQSYSEQEYKMQAFIIKFAIENNIKYEIDYTGNIGLNLINGLPCLVSHMDTVHDIVDNYKVIKNKGVYSSPTGIGGDDKIGIFIALQLVTSCNISCIFTVQEEVGGIGASGVKFDFKPAYFLQCDRKGNNEIIYQSSSTLATGDFKQLLNDRGNKFKYELSNKGSFTDVDILGDKYKVQACNIGCGYYNAHRQDEYIVLKDVANCLNFVSDFVENVRETYIKELKVDMWDDELMYYELGYPANEQPIGTCSNCDSDVYEDELDEGICQWCGDKLENSLQYVKLDKDII